MPEAARDHAPNVLVVDDDPDILEVMKLVLEDHGYAAVTACGGAAGLSCLRAGVLPQVILLDMMMPDVDGWAFRTAQASDPAYRDIPAVVMTADQRAAEKAQEVGAAAYLSKPVAIDVLVEMVARYCGPAAR